MSLSLVRSLSSLAGVLGRGSRQFPQRLAAIRTLTGACQARQTQRGFTRSILAMCNANSTSSTSYRRKTTKLCGCCGLHTAGDKELIEFLSDEIDLEKQSDKASNLPAIKGFQIASSEGSEVVLSKKDGNETIKVSFNVNNTVDDESGADFDAALEKGEEPPPAVMVSRPPFVVEINKGSDVTLSIQCAFPMTPDMPAGMPAESEQSYEDLIEIQEVALLSKDAKWEETTFAVTGGMMDGNLYDMLLNLLEERGIDGDFVDQLVAFSTSYEHKKYITFLAGLQEFVSSK